MSSHWHDARASSQNVGNHIGTRPCVRQSRLYRQYESGNAMKEMLGHGHLSWNVHKKQGAYKGAVYDHNNDGPAPRKPITQPPNRHNPAEFSAPKKVIDQNEPNPYVMAKKDKGAGRPQAITQNPAARNSNLYSDNIDDWNAPAVAPTVDNDKYYQEELARREEERLILRERQEAEQKLIEIQREQMRMKLAKKEDEISARIQKHRAAAYTEPVHVPGIRVPTSGNGFKTSNSSYGQYY